MATAIYGNIKGRHLRVNYYDQGNKTLEPYFTFNDDFLDNEEQWVGFHWWELRDILKALKEDDLEAYNLIVGVG